ncbi:hypothetical protein PIB30_070395 [Stylosanthes scabra]|uniref:Uncharacterized protein n=1 Tax=Stylosanthes scabra TaxID=79078 RepID=A0ABU6SNK1_9FABA|nr:hypothetical protein [Stylosanthes scabra]
MAIVASLRGKGIRLALPGPIKQSQSGYESGSSTLQSSKKPTELSTQKNEVGSSQSTQQVKQTKADYAFPIQTLMALQDQGVTKINKKSWAEICSESDEEIDLTQLITQVAKEKTIIQNPQEKAIVSKPQPQKVQANYIPTNKFSNIIQMEPEFWDESPNKVIPKIFPTGFHFKPTSPKRTRQLYEFILIDTDSITQKHSQSCKGMFMSNGGLNLTHQSHIQKRSENDSKAILGVNRYQIQKQPRFSIRKHKSKRPLQAHNRSNQSKESFNESSTYFKKMKNLHLMKKATKKVKTIRMKTTVLESILIMIKTETVVIV